MKKWFADNLAGPLSMFFIAMLGGGVFTLVSIALANQTELRLMTQFIHSSTDNDSRHDADDKKLSEAIAKLAEIQTEFKIEMSENETRDSIIRRDLDELRKKIQ